MLKCTTSAYKSEVWKNYISLEIKDNLTYTNKCGVQFLEIALYSIQAIRSASSSSPTINWYTMRAYVIPLKLLC